MSRYDEASSTKMQIVVEPGLWRSWGTMLRTERVLYHQIHPLKLVTDVATAIIAAALFWRHRAGVAFLVGFVPSIVITAILLRWADLEPYRRSPFGRYVRRFMTRRVEAARFAGLVPLWGGAWLGRPWVVAAGAAWIVGCWLWGLRRAGQGDGLADG